MKTSQSGFCREEHSLLLCSTVHLSNKDLLSTCFALGIVPDAGGKGGCSHGGVGRKETSSENKGCTYRVCLRLHGIPPFPHAESAFFWFDIPSITRLTSPF